MANGGRIDYTIGFNVDKSGLQNIQKELDKINQMSAKDIQSFNPSLNMNQAMSALKKAQIAAYDLKKAMNDAFNPTLGVTNIAKLQSSLKRLDLQEIQRRFAAIGPTGQKAFLDISKSALTTSVQLKQTSKFIDKIGTTLVNTIKWQFSSSLVNRFTGAVQQAIGYVRHLDTSLNDIQIITGKSADEMERFAVQANKAAQNLGKTTTDYTEASLIYYQQGLSDEEVAARAETTLKAANVTGQSTAAVSEELTAVWNGYKINTEQTEAAIDKLAAVAATTASDLQELSTGMSKVASAANAMGIDIDQLNAQIATIISVTRQAPESVGTALKTIYARMSDLKLGDTDEDGLGLGDVSGTLEKVGIAVLDTNGDLREMGDVIEDVAAKWNTWTTAQQTAIAQVMAGKRQYNNLVALFENWDLYSKALDTSQNSLGTLQKQQDIYMESTEAHINMLKAEWEDLYDSIIDESAIKGVSDFLRTILNLAGKVVDSLGGGMTLLAGLFAFIGTKLGKQLGSIFVPFLQNIQNAKTNLSQLDQISKNIDLFKRENGFGQRATEAMTKVQDQMRNYWHLMSESEINASMVAVREIGTWTQRADEIEKATEKIKEYIEIQGTSSQKQSLASGRQLFDGEDPNSSLTSNAIVTVLQRHKKEVQDLQNTYTSLDKTVVDLQGRGVTSFSNIDKSAKNTKKSISNFETLLTKIRNQFNNINNAGNESLIGKDKLEAAEKAIKQLETRLQELYQTGNKQTLTLFDTKTANAFNLLQDILGSLTGEYNNLIDAAQNYDQTQAQIERHILTSVDALELQKRQLQGLVNGYSTLVGGISSYLFAVQSIGNLGSIISNDDLTTSQKFLQILTNLAFTLPLLKTGIKNVTNGLIEIKKARAAAVALQTAENVASGTENVQDTAKIGLKTTLTAVIFGQAAAEGALATVTLAVVGAFAALAIAYGIIKAVSAARQKALEREAEAAKSQLETQEKLVEASKKEKEAVDELATSYHNLLQEKEQDSDFSEEQKNKIYELVKAYGDQQMVIQALAGDYESLQNSIANAQSAANTRLISDLEKEENAIRRSLVNDIIANADDSERNKEGFDFSQLGGLNKHRDFRNDLAKLIGSDVDVIDSSGHIGYDDLIKLLTADAEERERFLNKYRELDATDQIRELLSQNSENLSKLATNAENLTNAKLEEIGNAEQDNLNQIKNVEQYNQELEKLTKKAVESGVPEEAGKKWAQEFLRGYSDTLSNLEDESYLKESFDALLPSEEDFKERKAEIEKELKELQKGGGVNLLNRTPVKDMTGGDGYSTLYSSTYSNAQGNKAINVTPIQEDPITGEVIKILSQQELDKYAQDLLDGMSDTLNLQIGATFEGDDAIKQASDAAEYIHDLSEELDLEYKDVVDNFSDAFENCTREEKLWFIEHQKLVKQYAMPTDALYTYKEYLEELNNAGTVVKIKTVLTDLDGKEFKPENIQALFQNSNFGELTGTDVESFSKSTVEEQRATLLQYYLTAHQQEQDYQNFVKQGIQEEIEAKQTLVNYKQEELEKIKNTLEEDYKVEIAVVTQEGFQENLRIKLTEAATDVAEEFNLALFDEDQQNLAIQKFSENLNKGVDGYTNLTAVEQEYIDILEEEYGYTDASIVETYKKVKAAKEYEKQVKKLNLEGEGYKEQLAELTAASMELKDASIEVNEAGAEIDWSVFGQAVEEALTAVNKGIDDLQSAYDSLNDIVESYNETQILSMDNLQTILNMDTEYLSALEIENGQMSVNEAVLQQVALARLDEAEAIAYEQAMEELHNEVTKEGISGAYEANQSLVTLGNTAVDAGEAARQGAAGWREYWAAALNKEGLENDAYSQKVGQALYNKLQAIDTVRNQILSGQFKATVGKASKSSSGKSGSEKEPKTEKYLEREEDIYREINEQLKQIESTLGRIQKINDHEWGYDAQVTLEKENELLDLQLNKLEEKKKLQENDLSYRRKQLEDIGVNFSDDGSSMSNAEAVLNGLYAHYNQMVDTYNKMSVAEQETYKETLDAEKERIDKIDKKISGYESLYSEYQSTLDDILDKHFEQIENTVNQFNNMVEVHLEFDDAKKEWTDFWYDVVKDVEENNFAEQIAKSMSKLGVLVGVGLRDASGSQVAELTRHTAETVAEVSKQIQSAGSGGNLSIFGDDSKLAYETLKDYRDKLMSALEDAEKEVDRVGEVYLQILDDAQTKIDKQVDGWNAIGDQIQNDIDLITLISGDDTYEALAKQFELQYKNNLELVETQRRSKEYWQAEIDKYNSLLASTKEGSKEWKTYSAALEKSTENFKKAIQDLDSTVKKAIEDLNKWKDSQTKALLDTIDKNLSAGMGLSDLEDEWTLINRYANRYFDQVERSLAMEDVNLTFDKLLDNTNLSIDAQKKLNALREEEVKRLTEKDKLTQYDIDELKARLEITKQQMALEDAQRAKTNLRLRRDSQGNYSYQYTANESDLLSGREGMLSAKKDWYKLVKNNMIELSNDILSIEKEIYSKQEELANTNWENNREGEERLKNEIALLTQEKLFLEEQYSVGRQQLFKGTAEYFKEVEEAGMFPQWKSTLMQMSNAWYDGGKESFLGTVQDGIQKIEDLDEIFRERHHAILEEAGIDYTNLRDNGIDPTIDALDDLVDTNEDLAESLDETNSLLDQQAINLRQVEEAYNALKDAAVEAVESANNVLEELSKTAIETQQQVQASVRAAEQAASVTAKSYYSNKTTNPGGGTTGNGGGSTITTKMYKIATHPNGAYDTIAVYKKSGTRWVQWFIDGGLDTKRDDLKRRLSTRGITKDNTEGYTFRSGGYTGTWGGSNSIDDIKAGRLAVLHQKELVLNESDTKNLLNAVNVLRGISINQVAEGIIAASRAASTAINGVGAGLMQTIAGLTQNVQSGDTNTYSRNMTVNADFSGVKSAEAIYQALMELDNYGMQNAYSNAPHMNRAY